MVAYHQFVELSQSTDSEARGQAAHLAALAYLAHCGPADEQAALYAALVGFLDDPSVKVRAALAYGLLHTIAAPRPIILALLHDSGIIARAVAQYCPALLDTDLMAFIRDAEPTLLMAVAMRERLSPRISEALLDRRDRDVSPTETASPPRIRAARRGAVARRRGNGARRRRSARRAAGAARSASRRAAAAGRGGGRRALGHPPRQRRHPAQASRQIAA